LKLELNEALAAVNLEPKLKTIKSKKNSIPTKNIGSPRNLEI
jgi:hypothetical protein